MKFKVILLVCAGIAAAVFFTVTAISDRTPEGARRIKVEGEEAAATAAAALAMIGEAQKNSLRSFVRKYCADPGDGELGMFYKALKDVELASARPLAVEAFRSEPTRFNVFFPLAREEGRCQMVLRRDPVSGGWYFEKLYLLK